jgi:hypothetical protein
MQSKYFFPVLKRCAAGTLDSDGEGAGAKSRHMMPRRIYPHWRGAD